ncbi:T9SS type A sorting domain-containing protein [Flavobacterium lindanitolerans]|uniref:T9SS type A sorting domain-containing protein n=1 Tax=Flavobacterium lindanitolerans TaxID=428988 RepID=UPI0028071648|nr:T9SS type A sorting domain-containing protein [Flavobacterium lindanitolerans]MDQ7961647.1 T9SS type A sorting domain-containing protein [Flavobacterium lindanitolerans]
MKKTFFLFITILNGGFMYSQIFQAVTNQTFQGVFYGDSAVADFDNDGKTDFIISGAKPGYTGYSGLYKNNNGIFAENTNTALSPIMYSAIAVGDLNGDNNQDFIVTGTKTGENSPIVFEIYYNNGDGSFTKNTTSGIPGVKYGSVAIADLTNDGLPDIIVNGNLGSQYITKVFRQNQDGTFSDLNAGLLGTYFSAIKVFDANADGHPDILITGLSTNYRPETKLYINSGSGTFTEKTTTLPGIYISSIDAMDINGDGYPDLLISGTNYSRIPTLTIYTNDGSGNFTIQENGFTGIYNGNSKFIDYNNDGLIDVFSIGRNVNNENTVLLYKKNSNGTYTLDTENSAPIIAVYMSKGQWLDYDNDGDMDLLTIGFEDDNVAQTRLYENKIINEGNLNTVIFNKNDFKLYPNPTEGLINIKTREAIKNISIYNHLGQLITTQKQTQFNLENLASGIYMVRVDFENGQTANKKIIKK